MNSALPSGRALILFGWAMYARKGPLYEEGAVTEGDWGSFKNFSPGLPTATFPLYEEGGFFRCGGDRADRVVRPYKRSQRSLQIPMLPKHHIRQEIEEDAEE